MALTGHLWTKKGGSEYVESMWGRMKTEIGSWIDEAATLAELDGVLSERFCYYNQKRTPLLGELLDDHGEHFLEVRKGLRFRGAPRRGAEVFEGTVERAPPLLVRL